MEDNIIELKQGEVLLRTNDEIKCLYLILSGETDIYSRYGRISTSAGSILGLSGSLYGLSLYNYVAKSDCILRKFTVSGISDLEKILREYPDMVPDIVILNEHFIMELIKLYLSMMIKCKRKDPSFTPDSRLNKWVLDKHNGIASIPEDIKKAYFGANISNSAGIIIENTEFINLLHEICLDMSELLGINNDYIPKQQNAAARSPVPALTFTKDDFFILDELKGSLDKILDYSEIDDDTRASVTDTFRRFKICSDRLSSDENIRLLRKQITGFFYDIYYKVFIKSINDDAIPSYIYMFLNFGYMDEELAGEEVSVLLYKIYKAGDSLFNNDNIFTMYRWLKLVMSGEKNPSRNNFDQSYEEFIRQEIKNNSIDMPEESALNNCEMKLRFEIDNLFKSANYMTYGRVSTFVPVVIKENIAKNIPDAMLSADSVTDIITKIKEIDFSLFYRSIVYTNEELGVSQLYVYEEYLPEIILTPCIGSRGVLWQEINGRKRNSSARMLFPIFCNTIPENIFLNVMGKYRWEICRRIQGSYWNVATEKSLTSEYYDYLLFYKKNKDLLEQQKEKLKSLLINCRNNYSEVFAKDYETWINYESKGASKLNKISRNILAKYCPFNKDIRKVLRSNPIFTDCIDYYERHMLNDRRKYDNLIKVIQTKNIPVPKEIEETRAYYSK